MFLCFCPRKYELPSIEKTVFAKCTKSSRCLHFGRFKAINSSIYSVLAASVYWEIIFCTKLCFNCFQDPPYVFEQQSRKSLVFVTINTIGYCSPRIHLEGWKCLGNHVSNDRKLIKRTHIHLYIRCSVSVFSLFHCGFLRHLVTFSRKCCLISNQITEVELDWIIKNYKKSLCFS